MKNILWFISIILMISNFEAHANGFKDAIQLSKVKIDQNGVSKTYTYSKPLIISYWYGENISNSKYKNNLTVGISKGFDPLQIPKDVLDSDFEVGGDYDSITNAFKIPNVDIPEGCRFIGATKVIFKDISVWVSEYSDSRIASARIDKVLSAGEPELYCSKDEIE